MNSKHVLSLHRPYPASATKPLPSPLLLHRGSILHVPVRSRLPGPGPSSVHAQATPINLASIQVPGPSWPLSRIFVDQVNSADFSWLNQVTDNPLLAVLLSLLLLRLVPWIVNTFMSRIATPVLCLLLVWGAVTHPSQLMEAASAVSSYVTTQPETASRVVLLLALFALAPYILLIAGAMVAADLLISLAVR